MPDERPPKPPRSAPAARGLPVRSMLIFLAVLLAVGVGSNLLPGCGLNTDRFQLISLENLDGAPYLMVFTRPMVAGDGGTRGTFNLYRPIKSAADCNIWETLDEGRSGPAFGTFAWKDAEGAAFGVLHKQGASLFRFGTQPPKNTYLHLPIDWLAETGAQSGDLLYLFGAYVFKDEEEGQEEKPPQSEKLRVAEYDGKTVTELKIEAPPEIVNGRVGFWLKALPHQGKIQVFWRGYDTSAALELEPSLTHAGPLKCASFDGKAFGPVRTFANLPRGVVTVWSDGARLRAAVQTADPSFGKCASPRIYTLPDGGGEPVEELLPERMEPSRISFKFYQVDRIPVDGADVFLRSNSQVFEVWRATPEGWNVQPRPRGLPENGLERLLFVAFGVSVCIVAMGVGLAFRRRRQMALVAQKLKPSDVLAPLSLRVSAHLVDIALIVGATELYTWSAGLANPGLLHNLLDSWEMPVPYFMFYMAYLVVGEWAAGATVGKLALGLRVLSDKGERITLWSALVRNLIGFFERNPALAPFLALPTILFTPSSQRLGDMLARTIVVHKAAMDRFRTERREDAAAKVKASQNAATDSAPAATDSPKDPEKSAAGTADEKPTEDGKGGAA
ncbi:MAG: RDD family protein [Planctomycetes bacterium]|nr:RDD family protein [Planctomycetota bacterium]